MTFLHNNCVFDIFSLKYLENKSSFEKVWVWEWKIKPISLEWNIFNLSEIKWEAYKITCKWDLKISINDKIEIKKWRFAGKYSVKEVKKHNGIWFKTIKFLAVKIW